MGGGNYTRDAPKNSVINVNDFPSVKALADYLTYLTENPVSTYLFKSKCPLDLDLEPKYFWLIQIHYGPSMMLQGRPPLERH